MNFVISFKKVQQTQVSPKVGSVYAQLFENSLNLQQKAVRKEKRIIAICWYIYDRRTPWIYLVKDEAKWINIFANVESTW